MKFVSRLMVSALLMGLAPSCMAASGDSTTATSDSHAISQGRKASAARHPISHLKIIDLQVKTQRRGIKRFRVELAETGEEQAKGLMFRESMGANEGMLFTSEPPREVAFWMKNTVMPLDIIFIDTHGRILNIAANTVPFSLNPIPSEGPVTAVLELVAGRAAQLGLAPGNEVSWSD